MKPKAYLFSLCIVIALAGAVFGVPANSKVWTFTQPDGTTFQAVLLGDEFYSYHQTLEGEIILQDGTTGEWFYAEPRADGSLQKTAVRVGQDTAAISELNREKLQWLKAVQEAVDRKASEMRSDSGLKKVSAIGTIKGVLLLADFNDTSTTTKYSKADFDGLMNTPGYRSNNALGSVKDYYFESSYDRLTLQTEVSDWVRLPQPRSYYGKNDPNREDENPRQMIMDAITAADPTVNFADYDSDGDGWVDMFGVLHQGQGEEQNGASPDCIFSHHWSLEEPITVDRVKIQDYYTVPERYYSSLTTIGVFCHEIGHFLGVPDLYDYDKTSVSVGDWSIMASGAWLGPNNSRNGAKPCHFDPWCKYMLGWITPQVIYAPQGGISLPGFDIHPTALLIPVDPYQDGEYFLVANRYRRSASSAATGFDEYLPGSGALILHVDDYAPNNDDETRKKVDVEEADGLASLDMSLVENGYNKGDAGDLYPNGGSMLGDSTNPDSRDNDGLSTEIAINNFTGAGTDMMTCDITPHTLRNGYSIFYDSIDPKGRHIEHRGYPSDGAGDDYACVRFVTGQGGILERVKTYFVYEGTTDYTIKVFSGWLDNKPTGQLTTQSGSHTGNSYEEIFLSGPQTFNKGAEFAIEIRYNTLGGYGYPLPVVNDGDCSERTYVRSNSTDPYFQYTEANDRPYDALIRAGMRALSPSGSKPSVLICGAAYAGWLADIQQKLLGTGQFTKVDVVDVRNTTPALADLEAFDAVLVFRDTDYKDPTALGNVMADYVDAGGGVVCMMSEVGLDEGYGDMMQGRWNIEQYYVIPRGGHEVGPPAILGRVYDSAHPIMQGVSVFDGGSSSYRPSTFDIAPGAIRVADWSDGRPLVATEIVGGVQRVDLGFSPLSSDIIDGSWNASTDGARLMANALTWVAATNPSGETASIVGTWSFWFKADGPVPFGTISFNPDGTCTADNGAEGTWSQSGNSVSWTFPGGWMYWGTLSSYTEMTGWASSDGFYGEWGAIRQ